MAQGLSDFFAAMSKADYIKHWSTPVSESGCWLWEGYVEKGGYAMGVYRRKTGRAHRISYEAFYGPIPAGLHVCHKCDVRSCVNPDHLFLGTHAENMHDMIKKGRNTSGTLVKQHKLTEAQVIEIYKSSEKACALAAKFGVSKSMIQNIKNSKAWRQITRGLRKGVYKNGSPAPAWKALAVFNAPGTCTEIAEHFGVSRMFVSLIKRKKRRKTLLTR